MALADPQSLPTTPAATPLDRISTALGSFASADTTYELSVQHSRNSRSRHVVKLTQRKISADPLLPTTNREYTQSVHVVIDHPLQGFTAAEVTSFSEIFVNYLDTAGLLADIVQGQA
jgi:hypothetical protein